MELASGGKIALAAGDGAKDQPLAWFSPDGRYMLEIDDSAGVTKAPIPIAAISLYGPSQNLPKETARSQDEWMADLASPDATRGQIAVRHLARLGDPVIASLLRQVAYERTRAQIMSLIRNLDDDSFAVRDRASLDLSRLGRAAELQLTTAASGPGSKEVKSRVGRLLDSMDRSVECGEVLSQLRALQILAIINSDRAAEGVRELRKTAMNNRVCALADLTLFRLEFR